MFGFLRRNKETPETQTDIQSATETSGHASDNATSSQTAATSGASFTPPSARVAAPPISVVEEIVAKPTPQAEPDVIEQATTSTEEKTPEVIESITEVKSGSSFSPPTADDWARLDEEGMYLHLKDSLDKTRASLTDGMADLLLGKKVIDDELLEELETRLLSADVGVEATTKIITDLTRRISRKEVNDPVALFNALCDDMIEILQPVDQPLVIEDSDTPFVILVIGINGAGKTTTIGKLAKRFQHQGKSVMLAAGDTFRAAAVEQLQTWGERNNINVVAQGTGADSASVIYDAIESAKSKNIDIVIADTAGRLHTQTNLMDELIKIKRVMGKLDSSAPHETLLVV